MSAIDKTLLLNPLNRGALPARSWLLIPIILLGGAVIACSVGGSDVKRGSRALVEAFSKQRLIEPRLSGGFSAGEFNPSRDAGRGIDTLKLERARGWLQDAVAERQPSADLAYARFLLSEADKPAEAQTYLRRALAEAPASSEAHNDLGVWFIQQNKFEDAIGEFDEALKLRADMPEPLFNRAICYRRLLLSAAANDDLGRLMEIEHDKGWLDEAKRRRDELSTTADASRPQTEIIKELDVALRDDLTHAREIVDLNYDAVRRFFFFDLAQQYLGSNESTGQLANDAPLSRMKTIARLAVDVKGDRDMADTVTKLASVPPRKRAEELKLFVAYQQALGLFGLRRYDEAQLALERLDRLYAKRGDLLFQAKMKYSIARSLYHSRHFAESITLLEQIMPQLEANGWRYHQAQTLDVIGLDYSRLGQDSKALTYLHKSYELFQQMREPVAFPLQYIGLAYWHLGDFDGALENLRASTEVFLRGGANASELANNYLNAADVYRLLERRQLALLFADQALRYSNQARDTNRAAQALSFEAVQHAYATEFDVASEEIKQALERLGEIGAAERSYTEPLVRMRAGEVEVQRGDLTHALQAYDDAESLTSRAEGDPILHINSLRGRADAAVRAGRREQARKDLDEAVRIIESYRENLSGRVHRIDFLSASEGVFDQMILLDAEDPGRASEAFEMSERSRARGLLDEFTPGRIGKTRAAKPLSLAQVQAALPDKLTLLAYSVTSERTHVFLITRSEFRLATSPATEEQLDELVSEYVSEVKSKGPLDELSQKARALYQILIEPVKDHLSSDADLCIVPDKSLQVLPMGTLKDSSDKYLIEGHRLIYAPSASVFIRCLSRVNGHLAGNQERLLAVGNPEFDRERFSKLPDLIDAQREAEGASVFYKDPIVLTGAAADEPEVRGAMKTCTVAHLALHCLVDQQSPWLSALVLAPEKSTTTRAGSNSSSEKRAQARAEADNARASRTLSLSPRPQVDDPSDGLLYLDEVYNLNLPKLRLVVLSACETGLGRYYRGEGVVSLIHPFLAARVSTVVASLWPVESRATSELMLEFHKQRTSPRKQAGAALRLAQLKMIASADSAHPYYWASFIVVGGDY